MTRDLAAKVSRDVLLVTKRLNAMLLLMKRTCSARDFKRHRAAVGRILGSLFFDLLQPIYQEHPALAPRSLRTAKDRSVKPRKGTESRARTRSRKIH